MAYPVPKKQIRVEIKVSNSRFISTLRRVSTTGEAKAFIQCIREEMPDATHHVYAFKVGYGSSVAEGMSDDGEPSGTSGPPALAVLRGADIGDTAIVITRYFGGTKLGTGGLVSAYKTAAKAVLEAVETEPKIDWAHLKLTLPYNQVKPLKTLVTQRGGVIDEENFGAEVAWTVRMPADQVDAFTQQILDATSGRVRPVNT